MPALLDKRLIFVTGKGGVGKSTVATALGLVSARRGLRTIVVELGQQERVRRPFAPAPGPEPLPGRDREEVELAPAIRAALDDVSAIELGYPERPVG